MHGHSYEDGEDVYSFNYNGDFSGDVIVMHNHKTDEWPGYETVYEVRIPAVALIDLVGRFYNDELISKVENMTGAETLDFLLGRGK